MAWGAAFVRDRLRTPRCCGPPSASRRATWCCATCSTPGYIPLAAIDEVVVRQVMAVRADEKRYVSPPSATRSCAPSARRSARRRADGSPTRTTSATGSSTSPTVPGAASPAPRRPPARRDWAWPEIAGLAVTALGLRGRDHPLRSVAAFGLRGVAVSLGWLARGGGEPGLVSRAGDQALVAASRPTLTHRPLAESNPHAPPPGRNRPPLTVRSQRPSASRTSPLMASRRPAAAIRAASTPSSGCTGTTTSR